VKAIAATNTGAAVPAMGARTMSLGTAAAVFARYASPRIVAVLAVASIATRIVLGHWSLADLAVAGGILIVEPVLEWIIHVFGLHAKPKTLLGMKLDPLYARRHRMHHRDPRNVPLVFIPLPVLAGFVIVLFAFSWFVFGTRQMTATSFATMMTYLFTYEWIHYLIHSSYVPKGWLFRTIWRNHILHHYKNEKYWFGVTNPIGDYVLRTHPAKDSVPSSPTARTLGVDDEFDLLRAPATA
jgi:hypothetical protein